MADERQGSPGYEPANPPIKPAATIGALFFTVFLLMAAASVGIVVLFFYTDARRAAPDVPLPEQWRQQPSPRLTTLQGEHLVPLRERTEQLLTNYAWVDRDQNVVRIPIDRAMDLLADRLPVRDQ